MSCYNSNVKTYSYVPMLDFFISILSLNITHVHKIHKNHEHFQIICCQKCIKCLIFITED